MIYVIDDTGDPVSAVPISWTFSGGNCIDVEGVAMTDSVFARPCWAYTETQMLREGVEDLHLVKDTNNFSPEVQGVPCLLP